MSLLASSADYIHRPKQLAGNGFIFIASRRRSHILRKVCNITCGALVRSLRPFESSSFFLNCADDKRSEFMPEMEMRFEMRNENLGE
jgi:hypothetical protein